MAADYNVALRYNGKAGGYKGVVYWTSFDSKEELAKFLAQHDDQDVVEEGISQERAIALARATPLTSRVRAAIDDATDPEGNISREYLDLKLQTYGIGVAR